MAVLRLIGEMREGDLLTFVEHSPVKGVAENMSKIVLNHERVADIADPKARYVAMVRLLRVAFGFPAVAEASGWSDTRFRMVNSAIAPVSPLVNVDAHVRLHTAPNMPLDALVTQIRSVIGAMQEGMPSHARDDFQVGSHPSTDSLAIRYNRGVQAAYTRGTRDPLGNLQVEIKTPGVQPQVPYVMFAGMAAISSLTHLRVA